MKHGMSATKTYWTWTGMKSESKKGKIAICKEWEESFESFLRDMGEKPPGTKLERIHRNKGYEPGNTRWVEMTKVDRLGASTTPTYRAWRGMKRKKPRREFVCKEWEDSFENFVRDMGEKPPGTTLRRIDKNKGFEPGNVQWVTRSTPTLFEFNGKKQSLRDHAREMGLSYSVVYSRFYQLGWSLEDTLATPTQEYRTFQEQGGEK